MEYMKGLDDNAFDLTVTSPPYDNLRTYKDSLEWSEDIWKAIIKELYRVTKKGGVVVWVVGDATIKGSETGTSFKQALWAMECGFNLHDTMIWQKDSFSAVGALKTRYAPVFEYMFIFSKGKVKSFNPIKDRKNKYAGETVHGTIRKEDGSTVDMSGKNKKFIAEYGQRFNVWRQPAQRQMGDNCHPAPYPEKLANDHIISWGNEGDIVFDPFMGSGTTGKMAVKNRRSFVGCEKVKEYFDISKERIERETAQMDMF
jgi:site-specific DNA-methyltransferase (adenine-specific)